MMKRAIHIFPSFHSVDKIQEIRHRYDPLSDKIPPHITLVFPFESSIPSVDILVHIKSVAEHISPFPMTLRDVTGSGGEFLFLNVKEGNDFLIQLHDQLYEGILAPYRNPHFTYSPHITLGRPGNSEEYSSALEKCKDLRESYHTVVKEITLEEIGEDDVSNVIGRVPLKDNRF
ncbi:MULTISPECIES: 2'-5' RNA ligase family protein [Rossellomorea]|uniref:2'-5' RNA ligase family protein n=1 Tax=Rossellomorea TaxID=2837508 RepID=UPI001CC933DB|nr:MULTISPECIES: 2'-5' RNA ligase family protein [Rossellomorea]MCA0148032.1 2'-5' RNA ligase family protein [Rossellomorea vietnamensis]UTE75947.1 2'-5' RNA ligase family protein [Rossellomorea sp. KS-H15a]WGG43779.1 2'-5' RNA ligase family protein [Rossellomorea sp. DA94]